MKIHQQNENIRNGKINRAIHFNLYFKMRKVRN